MMSKPNLDNVPLQELVANNVEGIDVNYIKNFSNNAYENNYLNCREKDASQHSQVVKFRGTLYLEMHEAHAELAILWEDV
jgi:hypothetical protein